MLFQIVRTDVLADEFWSWIEPASLARNLGAVASCSFAVVATAATGCADQASRGPLPGKRLLRPLLRHLPDHAYAAPRGWRWATTPATTRALSLATHSPTVTTAPPTTRCSSAVPTRTSATCSTAKAVSWGRVFGPHQRTAVLIGYDDSDGWYDHKPSPLVMPSKSQYDALDGNGTCAHQPTLELDPNSLSAPRIIQAHSGFHPIRIKIRPAPVTHCHALPEVGR